MSLDTWAVVVATILAPVIAFLLMSKSKHRSWSLLIRIRRR
jgi:hypothetical protein